MTVWDELTCFLQVFDPGKAGAKPLLWTPEDMGVGWEEGSLVTPPEVSLAIYKVRLSSLVFY